MKSEIIIYTDNISWTLFGDEVFVFNELTNDIYLLRGVEKELWVSLDKEEMLSEIISKLVEKFEAHMKNVKNRLYKKIQEWEDKNLVVRREI